MGILEATSEHRYSPGCEPFVLTVGDARHFPPRARSQNRRWSARPGVVRVQDAAQMATVASRALRSVTVLYFDFLDGSRWPYGSLYRRRVIHASALGFCSLFGRHEQSLWTVHLHHTQILNDCAPQELT